VVTGNCHPSGRLAAVDRRGGNDRMHADRPWASTVGAQVERIALGVGEIRNRTVRLVPWTADQLGAEGDHTGEFGLEVGRVAGEVEMDRTGSHPAALDPEPTRTRTVGQHDPPIDVLALDLVQIGSGRPEPGERVGRR